MIQGQLLLDRRGKQNLLLWWKEKPQKEREEPDIRCQHAHSPHTPMRVKKGKVAIEGTTNTKRDLEGSKCEVGTLLLAS